MNNDSCYNCENRHLGCHSTCSIYANYKATLQIIKNNKKDEYNLYHRRKRKG